VAHFGSQEQQAENGLNKRVLVRNGPLLAPIERDSGHQLCLFGGRSCSATCQQGALFHPSKATSGCQRTNTVYYSNLSNKLTPFADRQNQAVM